MRVGVVGGVVLEGGRRGVRGLEMGGRRLCVCVVRL